MIRSVEIKEPSGVVPSWLGTVPALARPRRFDFKPGLNVVFGENGSGKSTLLRVLSTLFCCEQGGQPVVTDHAVESLRDYGVTSLAALEGKVVVDHDGQPVRCADPGVAAGLVGGLAGFDYDFMGAGVMNAMFKGSAGQTTLARVDEIVMQMVRGEVPELERKTRVPGWLAAFLKGRGGRGQPTVLLDESERSFDLDKQMRHWHMLRSVAPEVQLIVASHSPFSLELKEAHYVEMIPGQMARAQDLYLMAAAGIWGKKDVESIAEKRKSMGEILKRKAR